jgi:hypothetical protein
MTDIGGSVAIVVPAFYRERFISAASDSALA